MTDSATPLTALCNICHSAPPKYTCPRDKVRTCSLACAQSHKKRAACNGIRDPAAFVSKSHLTTSSGIDQDYNFLSGVERNLDKADRDVQDRGVSLSGQGKVAFEKRWHESGALSRYLREHRIQVHRAPVGMARQKANQTRFISKSKRTVWSVEWIAEGEKKVAEVDEKTTIGEAYKELLVEKERENKKRKRGAEDAGHGKTPKAKAGGPESPETSSSREMPETSKENNPSAEDTTKSSNETPTEEKSLGHTALLGSQTEPCAVPQSQEVLDSTIANLTSADSNSEVEGSSQQATQQPRFYLHKPHTSSKNTVIIPLHAGTTLTSALSGRSVLEFPTIYVFSHIPNGSEGQEHVLPEGLITESQYADEKAAEDKEVQALLGSLPEEQKRAALVSITAASSAAGKRGENEWDEGKVLEVLRRDVDALKR